MSLTHRLRTILSLTFKNTSQLRIGTGEEGDLFRDFLGRPYIPSTTLKGAARSLVEKAGYSEQANKLFGLIKTKDDEAQKGIVGSLVFSGATAENMHHGQSETENSKLIKRTAIDNASGTADNNKLYEQYHVIPDTIWAARLRIEGAISPAEKVAITKLLARLRGEGIQVGRNKGDGDGLLKLQLVSTGEVVEVRDGQVNFRAMSHEEIAEWSSAAPSIPFLPKGQVWRLTLKGLGPFAVLDGSRKTPTGDVHRDNVLKAVRDHNDMPVLPGSSLMGVLRNKAEWLEAVMHLRSGTENDFAITKRLFGSEADDEPSAGMLVVDHIKFEGQSEGWKTLTSVKIDRFTQGTIEGALYAVEAYTDPVFSVQLRLTTRGNDIDRAFVDTLITHLVEPGPNNGLQLGHGVNRGFGWFAVKRNGGQE